ncbi:MAG TPA: hypothetical protein VLH56_19285 [Dissulfurispiraceae bacterium]|nr:hypothetical protein [Dissulfurispiraceae bacterium]
MNTIRLFLSLAIILVTILAPGCKKSSRPAGMPPLEWENRPACAFAMPVPFGRWYKDSINVYFDFGQVYTHPGVTAPSYMLPMVSRAVRNQYDAWQARHGDLLPDTRLTENIADADVVIYIYYDPYTRGASSLTATDLLRIVTPDEVKSVSSTHRELPPQGANYNACVFPVVKRGVIYGAACAINGAACEHYIQYPAAQTLLDGFYLNVGNHEQGHWQLGFDDDRYGTIASLMCYHAMTQWPTECDLSVSNYCTAWLHKTRQTSGIDCGT